MALPTPTDTAAVARFGLEIQGVEIMSFQEISGLAEEFDVIKHEAMLPGGKKSVTLQIGHYKPGELTLTRGVGDSTALHEWVETVAAGDVSAARKDASIIFYDSMNTEIRRFNLFRCWPKKIEYGGLKASGNEVLTEKVSIVYEDLQRSK